MEIINNIDSESLENTQLNTNNNVGDNSQIVYLHRNRFENEEINNLNDEGFNNIDVGDNQNNENNVVTEVFPVNNRNNENITYFNKTFKSNIIVLVIIAFYYNFNKLFDLGGVEVNNYPKSALSSSLSGLSSISSISSIRRLFRKSYSNKRSLTVSTNLKASINAKKGNNSIENLLSKESMKKGKKIVKLGSKLFENTIIMINFTNLNKTLKNDSTLNETKVIKENKSKTYNT